MKIFIVILNWNGKDDTIECLKSIDKLRNPSDYEIKIIVVDNGSTDGSLEALSKMISPAFRLIENKKNLGFAAGNNVGVKVSLEERADWIMVLNNDTLVDRNFLINFAEFLEIIRT